MPIVSIIIPTCNRSDYLLPMLDAILAHVADAEIIVSDNSDTNKVEAMLADKIASGHVRYHYIPHPVSVVENFEQALALASGTFVTSLGDDDCIGPGFNEVVAWADAQQVDAVYSYATRFIANYFWPQVKSRYFGDGYQAKLFAKPYGGGATRIDGPSALRGAARTLGSGLGYMPRIYHGLVRRALLDTIRAKYGAVFGGVSPDIYSATLIALEAKRIYRVDAPFVLPGGSPQSTAGQGAAHTDRAGLFEVDHIRRFGPALVWSPLIPAYYAPYNVWAYSMLRALERSGSAVRPNLIGLGLKNLLGERRLRTETVAAMQTVVAQYGYARSAWDLLAAVANECISLTRRVYWKFGVRSSSHGNLQDIGAALDTLVANEAARGFDLRRVLGETAR